MTNIPFLRLNRLRVMRRGRAAYDQKFHDGVNIIRGQNGSGKSTIADFIFYVLGGDCEDWKSAASQCEEIQAEISTPNGPLTLKRNVHSKHSPIATFFGPMEDAENHALDGWEQFPIKRTASNASFSQVMFKSIGLPEARSEGASNITMHQILRLCYSDQRTPASRLFRFEQFDTQVIREAVGDLICGLDDFEIYEIGLKLRVLSKEVDGLLNKLNGLLKSLPPEKSYHSVDSIRSMLSDMGAERLGLLKEVSDVDQLVRNDSIKEHVKQRQQAQEKVTKEAERVALLEAKISVAQFEVRELEEFQNYLEDLSSRLEITEKAANAIGTVSFSHCPACGEQLKKDTPSGHCSVCQAPADIEKEKSQYNRIRIDMELQLRESRQLLTSKQATLGDDKQILRETKQTHEKALANYSLTYAGANGPREAFLAKRLQRIGHLEAALEYLAKSLSLAEDIDTIRLELSDKQVTLHETNAREKALQTRANFRRRIALDEVSKIGIQILKADLKRQPEFKNPAVLELNFRNDSVALDGKVNFAESSNVFLKNTAIFSLFLAAGIDKAFFHPRFLLLDNIEDKGMEVVRSQLFQRLIVENATELEVPYQVIFTTSMMNPELELQEYVIGPAYTEDNRTLNLGS